MKLQFQKSALLNGISIVSKAIPAKTTMSILECILIDADADQIKLTGNDMELGIETKVEGSILERGKIALDAKLFYEIIRKLPDGEAPVIITSDNKFNTTIQCESALFNILGRDGEEFSYLPYIERDQYITLSQFTLKEAIRQTIFSISPNDSNKMMAGELLEVKENILKKHTLEGVITLNKDTFYGVGVMPCIAIFTAGEPHPEGKECKFINFENDGFKVSPHIGLIETESAKDKKQHLLDVWFDKIEAETKFCVKTTIEATDEWLHSFYYFNDEIPTDADFEKTVGDYLSFEFAMIMQGRSYLFEEEE